MELNLLKAEKAGENMRRVAVDKKALDFLLKYVIVVLLITSVWLGALLYVYYPISHSEVENTTITIVDTYYRRDYYRGGGLTLYVGSDGELYHIRSFLFDNEVITKPVIGQTFECGVLREGRHLLYNTADIVSFKSNGNTIKDWTVDQTNREYRKSFLWLFVPYISLVVLIFFGLLYEVYLPNFKKARRLRKKAKKHKEKLERNQKYKEKFESMTEDDVAEWKHTQKNTSKKKLKRR